MSDLLVVRRFNGERHIIYVGRLHTLAANLATAAALCRAHQLGYANGWFTSKLGRDAGWKPGCEREQAVEI